MQGPSCTIRFSGLGVVGLPQARDRFARRCCPPSPCRPEWATAMTCCTGIVKIDRPAIGHADDQRQAAEPRSPARRPPARECPAACRRPAARLPWGCSAWTASTMGNPAAVKAALSSASRFSSGPRCAWKSHGASRPVASAGKVSISMDVTIPKCSSSKRQVSAPHARPRKRHRCVAAAACHAIA